MKIPLNRKEFEIFLECLRKDPGFQRKGWKRKLASFVYNHFCLRLWGHANGKRMTHDQAEYYAKGKFDQMAINHGQQVLRLGKEINRLSRLVEKRNRKISGLRQALAIAKGRATP